MGFQDAKLIIAQAGQHILVADQIFKTIGQGNQDLIAEIKAFSLIDNSEIDIRGLP